ncbi:MAG: hypothetical protein AAGF06_08480 [Pseudomonadota bacterium]
MKFIIIMILALPYTVFARPVSYPDSWTIMQQNNSDEHRLHLHYSPNASNSLGIVIRQFKEHNDKTLSSAVQWNHLLARRNAPRSQANVYSKLQVGINDEFDDTVYAQWNLSSDWETRRVFTAHDAKLLVHRNDVVTEQSLRLGVAPYLGDYGDLHTWLMVNVDHTPSNTDKVTVTPLIRLFKGNYLVEIGVSDDGDALVNWIIRL